MITLEQYYKGRDTQYAADLTDDIKSNAVETLRRANLLLDRFYAEFPDAAPRGCNSGWRPPAVNAATPNAAKKSKHMLAQAIDITDIDGTLDNWLMTQGGQSAMADIGLWHEHPESTPGWSHVQTVQFGSWVTGARRTFKVA